MNKWIRIAGIAFAMMLVLSTPAFAQDGGATAAAGGGGGVNFGAAFGAGMIILGAAFGIGRIGAAAVESIARQPEVAGNVQTAMLISAALIEGATFFGLIVCLVK